MAASHNDTSAVDGETYIEKYIKGVSAVESILTLDRLRQVRVVSALHPVDGLFYVCSPPSTIRHTHFVLISYITASIVLPKITHAGDLLLHLFLWTLTC